MPIPDDPFNGYDDPDDILSDLYPDEYPEGHTSALCGGCDEHHQVMDTIKWIADGATTLDEAIEALRGFASYLSERRDAGYTFSQPVDNGHLCYQQFEDDPREKAFTTRS